MELLTFQLGEVSVAVAASQVAQVLQWPAEVGVPVAELGRAAGISAPPPEGGRVLLCSAPVEQAFAIPAGPLLQRPAPVGTLIALPAALRRLRPPPWLAGLARFDGALSLLIDLHLLSLTVPSRGP